MFGSKMTKEKFLKHGSGFSFVMGDEEEVRFRINSKYIVDAEYNLLKDDELINVLEEYAREQLISMRENDFGLSINCMKFSPTFIEVNNKKVAKGERVCANVFAALSYLILKAKIDGKI